MLRELNDYGEPFSRFGTLRQEYIEAGLIKPAPDVPRFRPHNEHRAALGLLPVKCIELDRWAQKAAAKRIESYHRDGPAWNEPPFEEGDEL